MTNRKGKIAAIGFFGALVGAGAAVVASHILANKKTRDKINSKATELKNQFLDTVKNLKQESGDTVQSVKKIAKKASSKAKDIKDIVTKS